jgi:arylsulfatase A-like enzyme
MGLGLALSVSAAVAGCGSDDGSGSGGVGDHGGKAGPGTGGATGGGGAGGGAVGGAGGRGGGAGETGTGGSAGQGGGADVSGTGGAAGAGVGGGSAGTGGGVGGSAGAAGGGAGTAAGGSAGAIVGGGGAGGGFAGAGGHAGAGGAAAASKVIIFVWDGLRPDSVSAQTTPNLARMRDQQGVNFTDNHAVYPTFTMMNASAFATGSYPATHGFYGNTEYQPGPAGVSATGTANNFAQPIFTEDYGVLQALDAYYVAQNQGALFLVNTLFQVAHTAGLKTAAVGKTGAAFIQDYREDGTNGVILDENIAYPLSFATALQAAGFALPVNSPHYPFSSGTLTLATGNGDPTATTNSAIVRLADGSTSDPRALAGSPHNAKNEYMMGVYLDYILPHLNPDLSLVWFRNPDSTEHTFGPGSAAYLDALRDQDLLLGKLQDRLAALSLTATTNIIVVSDHGHSTVAGDPAFFPLRGLTGAADGSGAVGAVDTHGYAVSGDVRTADLLTRAGLAHVYDGTGCTYDPVISGIKPDGSQLYPTQTDTTGTICGGTAGAKYTTGSFRVPATVPTDAVIIAANGGSDYFYVPSHDVALVKQVVTALQQRKPYGAVFVRSTYGAIPGTLPLTAIKLEGSTRSSPPTPDIMVSFDWSDTAVTAGGATLPGTEYESAQNNRGMHGSFSPIDVHNTLVAAGPGFKTGFQDTYPTGNVDVAPTAARLLGLSLPQADGRPLEEALLGTNVTYAVAASTTVVPPVTLTAVCNPDDLACATPAAETSYGFTLYKKTLTVIDSTTSYVYFDKAKATRQ